MENVSFYCWNLPYICLSLEENGEKNGIERRRREGEEEQEKRRSKGGEEEEQEKRRSKGGEEEEKEKEKEGGGGGGGELGRRTRLGLPKKERERGGSRLGRLMGGKERIYEVGE